MKLIIFLLLVVSISHLFAKEGLNPAHEKILGLQLRTKTIEEVKKRFGEVGDLPREDAQYDNIKFCYWFSNMKNVFLTFEASWNGGFSLVDGYSIEFVPPESQSLKTYQRLKACSENKVAPKFTSTFAGVKLQMSRQKFIDLFHETEKKVSESNKTTIRYSIMSKQDFSPEKIEELFKNKGRRFKGEKRNDTVEALFKDDKLIKFRLILSHEFVY